MPKEAKHDVGVKAGLQKDEPLFLRITDAELDGQHRSRPTPARLRKLVRRAVRMSSMSHLVMRGRSKPNSCKVTDAAATQ